MTRIGRDHGKFVSEVGELNMSEIAWYEAVYRYETEEHNKAQAKIAAKNRK